MPIHKKRWIEAEDLYRLQNIFTPRISPDGDRVIYSQQRVDKKTEKKLANLWMVQTANGKSQQFTWGDQADTNPRWSPDGSQIAFFSNRKDKEKPSQIFLIPGNGGEARPLTDIPGTILSFAWSPNGKFLLCAVRKTDKDVLEREKDEQLKKLGTIARQYDRLFYKLDGVGYLPKERIHLWVVDAESGRSRQITDHQIFDELTPTWSPDSRFIAFISNHSPDPDQRPDADDLFIMPAKGGEAHTLPASLGPKTLPSFSPDGKWIAYYGVEGEDLSYKNNSLWVIPVDGSRPAQNLTEIHDLHISAWTINDLAEPETMPPTWSNDSSSIYFPVTIHGSSILMRVDLSGKNLQTVIGKGGVVGSFSFDRTQTKLAYFYGKMDEPGQVYCLDMPSNTIRQLTQVNQELMAQILLSQVKEVWIKGPVGNDLQGWIMFPPDFDPTQRYPSILEIHGGPRTQYGFYFFHEFYYLAAHGYIVHFTNPRGGRGYGEEHTKAIWQDWGGADYDDLMAWTDYVANEPYIDSNRMGVTGGSYGGYMTVWIIGHTDRFRAAVTTRCVSNLISMWGSSDFNWTFQVEAGNKPPFENLEKFWKHSPIAYIGNAKTPTMVIHNEFDLRCPIEQGEQVFVALKKLAVDTEFIRFPDEFHGLSRTGRTDRRIARINHIRRWFDKYLKS